MRTVIAAIALAAMTATSFAQQEPIQVKIQTEERNDNQTCLDLQEGDDTGSMNCDPGKMYLHQTLIVTALQDGVTVHKVVVNRGNCRPSVWAAVTLNYGESMPVNVGNCNILEIEVSTNTGKFLFQP